MVSAIDITIVIVYLLIMLGVGYLSGKIIKHRMIISLQDIQCHGYQLHYQLQRL